jgi:hypothetical protein
MPPANINFHPANSVSGVSLALTTPATVSLWPANGASSASMALSTSEVAGASGAIGMPGVAVQTNSAAEVHPHDWHLPKSVLDAGPLTLTVAITVAYVAVRERFRFEFPDTI